MVYTEIKERNGRKYYYRVLSVRKGGGVSKKRIYLGVNLNDKEINFGTREADMKLDLKGEKLKEFKKIKLQVIRVLRRNGVKKAGIFGSYARGEQKKNSDVDILVEIGNKVGLFEVINLKSKLEEKLKKKVDLVEYELIRPEIRERILADEVPVIR